MRAKNTERVGVHATGYIFSNDIDWIFREQTQVDVGIDALIEESKNSNPTGKFLAAQIKTGLGNFHKSQSSLTYYISQIHYNYWLNFTIPIILVAHLPESKKTLWQFISKKNIKSTNKKWKIEIPLNKLLNSEAKSELKAIIDGDYAPKYYQEIAKGELSESELRKIISGTTSIIKSNNSILEVKSIIENLGLITNKMTEKVKNYVSLGYSVQDKEIKVATKKYSQNLNQYSKKLDAEIKRFAEYFSEGFRSYERLAYIYFEITKNYKELRNTYNVLNNLGPGLDVALKGLIIMRDEISGLPRNYHHLKKARMNLLESTEQVIQEMKIAKEMTSKFKNNLDKILN